MEELHSAEAVCYTSTKPENCSYSDFQNENLLYLQPPKRHLLKQEAAYKMPRVRIESATTYNLSYMKCNSSLAVQSSLKHEKGTNSITGKCDFDTVYGLAYKVPEGKLTKPFIPKSCLTINGSQNMTTTHTMSYMRPKYVRVYSCKPFEGKVLNRVPLECKTIMKESYKKDACMPIIIDKPIKRQFWQTKFKTDYQTVNNLSYTHVGQVSKKVQVQHQRPSINAQIERNTTSSSSFQIPGRFLNKNELNN